MLRAKWNAMKTRLSVGDIAGAVHYHALGMRAHYNAEYTVLSARLPEIAAGMNDIDLIVVYEGRAKFRLRQLEPEGLITYYVYFVVDRDGIWRLERY